jgi:putative Holliday junction resolvase
MMGIDYGEKRIGIALSDPKKIFAYSFTTIENKKDYFYKLQEIIREKNVEKIILGLPSLSFKSSKLVAEKVKELKMKLEQTIKIIVELWDEEYTSKIAEEKIRSSVTKKSKRKNKAIKDSFAAAVILQEYLDNR